MQPDVPPHLLGIILSTYFGGRSEVRIRREACQVVLCDFLSMYPTVCTLMGLWRFVISQGMTWHDDTRAVASHLERVTRDELRQQACWRELHVLVQIESAGAIVPVRADYDATGSTTIGLNHLTSEQPLWFTLADCIASKLLTGRAPKVVRAIRIVPMAVQEGLHSININGDAARQVNPAQDDFYKLLIELRQNVKLELEDAQDGMKMHLGTLQHALKITANATSYGIFAEVNVSERDEHCTVNLHTGEDEPAR